MKTLLLCLIVLLASSSFGQKKDFKRWKVGSVISFDKQLGEKYLSDVELNLSYQNGVSYADRIHVPESSSEKIEPLSIDFTFGFVGQFSLTPKIEIGTGITLSRKTFRKHYYETWWTCWDEVSIGSHYYINQSNNYLDIPVFIRYNFLQSKLNFHVESGLTTSHLLEKEQVYGITKWSLFGQAGLGASYTLGNGIQFSSTAFYKRKLTNLDRSQDLFHTNSISFEVRTAFIF
jgi:hypothetical protein